jgi:nicotinamide phosphoribosyltransferase
MNLILNTDSYKASHWLQYPKGTEHVYSYIESRGGVYPETLFFGLQMFLKEYLSKPVTLEDINEASHFFQAHGEPFNREGWLRLLEKHGGKLPVRIRAVKEGTVVPVSNVLVTVENTDPEFFWLTSYLETALLRAVWAPTTVATVSFQIKKLIKGWLEKTGDLNGLPFKLHDFGARGVSSYESAGICGAAHLVNFSGTDTVTGILFAKKYYGGIEMPAFSIPAAEHSTITAFGRDGETDAYRNMLTQFAKPGSVVAVVSDSYDIYNAVENIWGKALREEVIKSGATVVIRPDSGNPPEVVLKCLQLLDASFGSVVNEKGFKVLNSVRVIQGDGVCHESIEEIIETIVGNGYSVDNVAFGMGGALLQHPHRDTQKFAMKASAMRVNGEWRDIYKQPVGDNSKVSKRGRVKLYSMSGRFFSASGIDAHSDVMHDVFCDGELLCDWTLGDVRELAGRFLLSNVDSRRLFPANL